MKKLLMIGFLLILISFVFSEDLCTSAPCIVSKDDGVLSGFLIAPNLDINFLNSTIHEGQATHDFDLNFSLRQPDGNFLHKDVPVTQADKNGLWFFQIIGGFSQIGDYLVIWDGQHLIGGVPDGNHDTESWQIKIQSVASRGLCKIEADAFNNEDDFYFSADIADSNGSFSGIFPRISLFNQKFGRIIFENETMNESLTGNYFFSKSIFLNNGVYSYVIEVDPNFSKSFNLNIEDMPEITNIGTRMIQPKPINTSSGFDIWGFIEKNASTILVLLVVLIIIIGGFVYFRKR